MALTLRSQQELDLIDSVLGEHYQDQEALEDFRQAACIAALRRAEIRILKEFDAFCSDNGIKYFLYGATLKGAVAYNDFIPGDSTMSLGMLRAEYERFVEAYEARKQQLGKEPFGFWRLRGVGMEPDYLHRLPRLTTKKPVPVEFGGDYIYGAMSMPLEVEPYAEISVFDEVPDDFFTRKKFFRQMKRRNDNYNRMNTGRELLKRDFDTSLTSEQLSARYANMSPWRALRWSLLPRKLAFNMVHDKAQRYAGRGMECVTCVVGSRSKTVPATDLGECPYTEFAGIKARIPERPDAWAMPPVLETTPELKRLQEDAKVIVTEIDRICQALGIQYFACGGTMLGYVRHGGFIPWDDDIDVGMLRADYERFKAEAGALIDSERFFLQTRATDPQIPYLFSKVRLQGSDYITEYNKDRDYHKGICVDIFPFDYIPNSFSKQVAFESKVRAASRAHNRIVNRQYPAKSTVTPEGTRKDLDWLIAQINGRLLARHYWSKSLDATQAHYDEVATTYNAVAKEKKLKMVASFVPTYTMAKVEDLFPVQRVDFEGIHLNIPRKPELFLRMQYGDYMALPYLHQRMGHDLLLWADANGVGGGRLDQEMLEAQQG